MKTLLKVLVLVAIAVGTLISVKMIVEICDQMKKRYISVEVER